MKQITKAQLEDIVEHISDNIGGYIYNSAAQNIAPTEATTTTSQEYKVGEQFYYNKILYTATVPIANGGTIVISGENKNCEPSPTLTKQLADLAKNNTSVVTDSTKLVESGAVKDIVGWGNKNLIYTKLSGYNVDSSGIVQTGSAYSLAVAKVEANKEYTVSPRASFTDTNIVFSFFVNKITKNSVSYNNARTIISTEDNSYTLTAPIDGYVAIRVNTVNDNIQLEKGTVATSYEPYHASVEETLRDAEVIEGKNLLENTATSQTVEGVTFTVNADKSVTVNGTATNTIIYKIGEVRCSGSYILNGCPNGGSQSTYRLDARNENSAVFVEQYGENASFTYTGTATVCIRIQVGTTVNNLKFYPMVSVNGGKYEPYYIPLKDVVPTKADNSVIGTVEDGATASKDYAVGDYFIKDGEFCTATSSISANTALTKNSNYKTEVIGDILNDLYASIGYLSSPVSSMVANHAPCLKRDITTAFYSGTLRAEIAEGNFRNVRPGDYIIGQATGSTYYVAHLDYMYNLGDQTGSAYQSQAYGKHHLGLMLYKPVGTTSLWLGKGEAGGSWQVSANDKGRCPWNAATDVDPTSTAALGSNNTNITRTYNGASVSGYMGSFIRERIDAILLPQCFQADFGSANVLKFRNLNGNAITTDKPAGGQSNWNGLTTGWAWYDRYTDLPSEVELYGTRVFCSAYDIGVQNRQLAIYRNADINDFYPRMDIWTKGVASSTFACSRNYGGHANAYGAGFALWACPLACVA